MCLAAWFEMDFARVPYVGLACFFAKSVSLHIVEGMIATHKNHPDHWWKCWNVIAEKGVPAGPSVLKALSSALWNQTFSKTLLFFSLSRSRPRRLV